MEVSLDEDAGRPDVRVTQGVVPDVGESCICRSYLCSDTLHLCETAVLVVVRDGNRRALYWQVWQDTREFL